MLSREKLFFNLNKDELLRREAFRLFLEENKKYIHFKGQLHVGASELDLIKIINNRTDILEKGKEINAFIIVKLFEHLDANRHIDDFIEWLNNSEKKGLVLHNITYISFLYRQFKEVSLYKAGVNKKDRELELKTIETSFNTLFNYNEDEQITENRIKFQVELLKANIADLEYYMNLFNEDEENEEATDCFINVGDNLEDLSTELKLNLQNSKYSF